MHYKTIKWTRMLIVCIDRIKDDSIYCVFCSINLIFVPFCRSFEIQRENFDMKTHFIDLILNGHFSRDFFVSFYEFYDHTFSNYFDCFFRFFEHFSQFSHFLAILINFYVLCQFKVIFTFLKHNNDINFSTFFDNFNQLFTFLNKFYQFSTFLQNFL